MSKDHYAAVIADLERKRTEIDKLIESLKSFSGNVHGVTQSAPAARADGEFTHMPMADAAKVVLGRTGKPLGNAEILEALEAGGLVSQSENKLNTLGSALNRRANDVGDIVRVGRGTWGLPDWGIPAISRAEILYGED